MQRRAIGALQSINEPRTIAVSPNRKVNRKANETFRDDNDTIQMCRRSVNVVGSSSLAFHVP